MNTDQNELEVLSKGADTRMKNPRLKTKYTNTVIVLGILIVAVLIGLIPRLRERAALAVETSRLAVPTVTVVLPTPGNATTGLILPAQVEPWMEAPLYARVSGYLKSWKTDIGAHVKAGQLLAVIETPELDQELDQARHQLTQAEAALSIAKITAARYAELVKTASVSEQDNAEKQADLAMSEANVAAARANVRRLEYTQSFAHVTAPFTGTVTARTVDVGQLITANGTQLFRLSQTNKLRVYINVPQDEAFGITHGIAAELLISGLPNHPFKATVVTTANQISDASRTLLTQLEVDNASGQILAGSFGQVKLAAARSETLLTLPENTVMFGAHGSRVEVVLPDGKVASRDVKLGRNLGETYEILGGVTPQDRVVSNPSDWLIGAEVKAVVPKGMKQEHPQ
jgi:membrane fusion protein (multidrug efflux system)